MIEAGRRKAVRKLRRKLYVAMAAVRCRLPWSNRRHARHRHGGNGPEKAGTRGFTKLRVK